MAIIGIKYPGNLIVNKYFGKHFSRLEEFSYEVKDSGDNDSIIKFVHDNIDVEYKKRNSSEYGVAIYIDKKLFFSNGLIRVKEYGSGYFDGIVINNDTIKYVMDLNMDFSNLKKVILEDISDCDIMDGKYIHTICSKKCGINNPKNYNIMCKEFISDCDQKYAGVWDYDKKYKSINVLIQNYRHYENKIFTSPPLIMELTESVDDIINLWQNVQQALDDDVFMIKITPTDFECSEKIDKLRKFMIKWMGPCEQKILNNETLPFYLEMGCDYNFIHPSHFNYFYSNTCAMINKNHRLYDGTKDCYFGHYVCKRYVETMRFSKVKSVDKN